MKIVFSDFDGTLTNNGKLSAVFFDLIQLVENNNSELVIVSGRSLSWGHFFLTHFPLKHVIMEGGGAILSKTKDGFLKEENLVSDETVIELEKVTQKLMKEIPDCVLSLDSFGRRTDRAIEFSQMNTESVEKVEHFFKTNNINYSRSNVHINFWIEDISKSNGVSYFLKNYSPHIKEDDCIFYGDAANDESMFKYFSNTVGVSNIISVLDKLEHKPKIILEGKENTGINGVYSHLSEIFTNSEDF